jgi:hypothetical protein
MNALSGKQCTEVGRAFLIHFQKIFFQKQFLCIKISHRTQILCMDRFKGLKSLKNGQKMMKIATNLVYDAFFQIILSWLI